MELMPDVQYVWAVGPEGMVLGQNFAAVSSWCGGTG